MRRSVMTPVRVGAAALLVGASAVLGAPFGMSGAAGAAGVDVEELAESMHGAVETQAITVGNGALSLLVDPGTAYAYSTLDRDDYGFGTPSFTMTARGANVNLGTIAYAVLWAPPSCGESKNIPCMLSGGYHEDGFNTGLHEAKGFPGYAEALYPPPPEGSGPSQERVYKCIVNKDGTGSPPTSGQAQEICKTSKSVPMSAWAEVVDEEVRATGFSRAAGFDVPGAISVLGSESFSDVSPLPGGLVKSTGFSNVSGISLLGGAITIDNVFSTATIVSSVDGVDRKRSSSLCTFSGLTVMGQGFKTTAGDLANPSLQKQLDAVAAATDYKVEILPPTETDVAQVDEGKFVSGCSGLQIKFTDMHTQAPVPLCFQNAPEGTPTEIPRCVPALGNREELSFGRISVQQAVQNLAFDFGGGGLPVGGGDFTSIGGGSDAGADAGTGSLVSDAPAAPSGGSDIVPLAPSAPAGSGGGRGGSGSGSGGEYAYDNAGISKGLNIGLIGTLTALSGAAAILGGMVLVGVVNALATGRPFRMPGMPA